MDDNQVYQAIGEEGFERLVAAFYRQIPTDDILGPMYAGRDMREAEIRIRDCGCGTSPLR
jgi:hemoglobin